MDSVLGVPQPSFLTYVDVCVCVCVCREQKGDCLQQMMIVDSVLGVPQPSFLTYVDVLSLIHI